METVKNAGKANEAVEVKYFGSDAAWFKRIRRELGSGKGRSPHWLIFNDEAHHAYRRGDAGVKESLDEDMDLAKKNDREATVWIEGLDRINKLAGGSRRRGINSASICLRRRSTFKDPATKLANPFLGLYLILGFWTRSNLAWSKSCNCLPVM